MVGVQARGVTVSSQELTRAVGGVEHLPRSGCPPTAGVLRGGGVVSKRVCFTKVDPVDADRIHISDAIRAAVFDGVPGVSGFAIKALLLTALSHMNLDGGVWSFDRMTMGQLSHETNISKRHLRRARAGSESIGCLTTEQRNWSTNVFTLNVDALLEAGRHGQAMMNSERARRRSKSVRVKMDAAYHAARSDGDAPEGGKVTEEGPSTEQALEHIAGAVPDTYSEEPWRDRNPGWIFAHAFRDWPQLAATNRAGNRLFKERTGEDRSIAAWHRDCELIAEYLRTSQSELAQWALEGAKRPGGNSLRITTTSGWGQLLHAAREGTLLNVPGVDPAGETDPVPLLVDVGSGLLPSPMGTWVEAWRTVRQAVTDRSNDPRLDEVWLNKGKAVGVEDGRLVVEFPNRFYVNHVAQEAGIYWEAVDIPIRLTCTGCPGRREPTRCLPTLPATPDSPCELGVAAWGGRSVGPF